MKGFEPNRESFGNDPFSYSVKAFLQLNMMHALMDGGDFDPYREPNEQELKNPTLWLTQSEALTQAAIALVNFEPEFENMPPIFKGICDSQYCAVALMLVGYSLEIGLKGMKFMQVGPESYRSLEKSIKHHDLHELAEFVPNLIEKDKAILKGLTHFIYWAGRYLDPGSGKERKTMEIFELAEAHRITMKCVLELAAKVCKHAKSLAP